MVTAQVTSMLVMGVLAAVVIAAIARSQPWQSYQPDTNEAIGPGRSSAGREQDSMLGGTGVWIGLFLLLSLGAVAGVALFVTSGAAPTGLLSAPIVIGSALFVGIYLVLGVYVTAMQRGHPRSMAAAETATVVGALFLVAVSMQLIGA